MKVRSLLASAVLAVGSLIALAPSASASEVCYSVHVNVNGGDVVNEAGCQEF
jgi:hypothetical protein